MATSRSSRQTPGWGRPLRLLLRLVLMGVGLGVITGSALKLAGTGAQRGDWPIPSWLVSTEIAPQDEAALTATGSNGLLSNRNDNLGRLKRAMNSQP